MNIEGRIIGNRYEIIEKAGSGGMATVYKARDTILNRYVAVKVLRDEFTTDEEFIKRFNTEAQSAARLTHPNIVSVFDVGQEYNIYYIVMELIQGKTLKQIISEEGALPWKWTVNIAIQICSALEMAHRNGIVHRDIKPHNIIITEDGIAKVTDFGIAKAVSNSTITAFGTTLGSVHYFSPEHARGGYTDAKSDLYSLGIVMYEMITGKVPFDADTPVSVALKHMQEEPIAPIKLNSNIPVAVNDIILKAMKKDTNERYGSATLMIKDLSMALKNPNGDFVKEGATGDFTRVIPTIQDNMVSENKYKSRSGVSDDTILRNRTNNRNYSNTSRQPIQEDTKGLKKYLEENPKMKPVVIGGIAIGIILLCILIPFVSYKVASNLLGFNPSQSEQTGISLPGVTSLTVDEAKKKFDDMGIKYTIDEAYSDSVEEGKVISQKPEEGSNYDKEKNSPVKIVVSKGIKVVKMPKVIGMDIEAATEELRKIELEVKEEREESVTVQENYVIRQEFDEGKEIPAGSEVKLVVSKGPKKITLESVEDMKEEEAKKKLTDAGLEVNVKYKEDESKSNRIVLQQSIEAGSVVTEGTQITLTVNKVPEKVKGTININVKKMADSALANVVIDTSEDEKDNKNEKDTNQNVTVRVTVAGEKIYEGDVARNIELLTKSFEAKQGAEIKVYINDILPGGVTYKVPDNETNPVINVP